MKLRNLKLYGALSLLALILGLMLVNEIKKYRSITTSATTEPLIAESSTPLPISTADKPLGYIAAPLIIVEYQDLGSKRGRAIHEELSNFVRAHSREVRLYFKHAPVTSLVFTDGVLAHKATYCAGQQKTKGDQPMNWIFLDTFISKNLGLREPELQKAAIDTGLNIPLWSNCLASKNTAAAINKDFEEAVNLQLGAPPLIFINNKKLNTELGVNLSDLLSSLTAK